MSCSSASGNCLVSLHGVAMAGLKPGDKYAAENSFIVKADIGKAGASHDH